MKNLADFAKYLRENRLKEYVIYYLEVMKGMDIPIIKLVIEKGLIKDISEENSINMTMVSQEKYFKTLEDGTALAVSKVSLKMWEEDKLPGINKHEILPSDLVLIYAAQKKAIFHFLPDYTSSATETVAVVQEFEDLFTEMQNEASQMLFKIQKETEMQLELANKELESFSYSVSHDLRAPLRAIRGYTKILQEDYSASLEEEAKKMMYSVAGNAERMSQLIDDLLAFSKMGKKEMNLGKVNMTEVAKNSLETIKMAQNNKVKATVTINELLPVIADNALMANVFTNLISNAIKYSSKSENPVVEVSSYNKDGEYIYAVKDNGVGFDMKYYDKLFGVFQRLHSVAEFDGTGVGLALVKRIVTRHGGRVWAEAEIGKGATFYVALQTMKQ